MDNTTLFQLLVATWIVIAAVFTATGGLFLYSRIQSLRNRVAISDVAKVPTADEWTARYAMVDRVVDSIDSRASLFRSIDTGGHGATFLHVYGEDFKTARYSYKSGEAAAVQEVGYSAKADDQDTPRKLLFSMGGSDMVNAYGPMYEAALKGGFRARGDIFGSHRFVTMLIPDPECAGKATVFGVSIDALLKMYNTTSPAPRSYEGPDAAHDDR